MSTDQKGRILRLKQGYNPNSSSIGTIVFAMPAALMATTVAFGAAAAFISTAFAAQGKDPPPGASPEGDTPAPGDEGDETRD